MTRTDGAAPIGRMKNAAELTAEAMHEALDRGPDPIGALQQFVSGLSPEEERALRELLAGGSG